MVNNSQNTEINKEISIHNNPVVRWIFIISGFILVGIGILGMFLPLLPTTIFFILAAWCFARSSERFHQWMHNNRLFGRYLTNYRIKKGMTAGSKIFSIAFLLTGIGISVIFFTEYIYVRILLLIIAAGVTWHLLAIKTIKKNGE